MKIKYKNLNKILDNCTSKEIDFIIEIAQYQDEYGMVKGINYKDIIENINISKSTFFKLLNILQDKQIIKINYLEQEYNFWNIEIIDNDFSASANYKDGYLNINIDFLHSSEFKKLKRAEKVIILNLIKLSFNRNKIKVSLQTLSKWTGCKKQSILYYIKKLSNFFEITRDYDMYTFYMNGQFYNKSNTEKDVNNRHKLTYLSRKNRIPICKNSIKNVANLFNQYTNINPSIIFDIIEKSIKKIKLLEVKYIHKYLSNYIKFTGISIYK